ncbi:uncharacterized protein LOC143450689 [Clavelina lepadiformis]|uniref:uncharacterized protein LOC143450689 n=1 Tax=Clavelina lepadiformis TaxID=159417 RepID=UPI004042041F
MMEGLWWSGTENLLALRKDLKIPTIKTPTDVKIKVAYGGVCGSDLHFIDGVMGPLGAKSDGLILGHEFSGTVVEHGSAGKFKIGDRVCVNPNLCCGECHWNDEGLPLFCEKNPGYGCTTDGGLADYFVVDQSHVHELPENVNLKEGALAEPLSCVLRAWRRLEPLPRSKDTKILVQGAGIIGALFCALLHHNGYTNVTVTEPHEGRRKLMSGIGFNYNVIDPKELEAVVGEDISRDGFSLIFDSTGNIAAVQKAFELVRRGATICIFGCCPAGKTVAFEPLQMINKELTIVGNFANTRCMEDAVSLMGELAGEGILDCEKLGVEIFKLDQFNQALRTVRRGKATKAMFQVER